MAKRSGPLQYTPVQPTDTDFPLLNALATKLRGYYVTYFDAVLTTRQIWGEFKNFTQSFRQCKALGGSTPRCFVFGVTGWLAVNPVKMPH